MVFEIIWKSKWMWDGLFFNGWWKNWRQGNMKKEKRSKKWSGGGWGGWGCKYEEKIKIDEKKVDNLNERPHTNVNNEAYHMHEIMFMDKIDHKYTIVQKLITCKNTSKIKILMKFSIQIDSTMHEYFNVHKCTLSHI